MNKIKYFRIVKLPQVLCFVFHWSVQIVPVVILHSQLLFAIDSDDFQSKHNEVVFEIVQIQKYKYKMESKIQREKS
jgi:hypothetical protein